MTAGAVVAAVAADTVASLAMMGRSVGSVAVRYGYDVRLPDEELFAMGALIRPCRPAARDATPERKRFWGSQTGSQRGANNGRYQAMPDGNDR